MLELVVRIMCDVCGRRSSEDSDYQVLEQRLIGSEWTFRILDTSNHMCPQCSKAAFHRDPEENASV